jgi:hypothetical protein
MKAILPVLFALCALISAQDSKFVALWKRQPEEVSKKFEHRGDAMRRRVLRLTRFWLRATITSTG